MARTTSLIRKAAFLVSAYLINCDSSNPLDFQTAITGLFDMTVDTSAQVSLYKNEYNSVRTRELQGRDWSSLTVAERAPIHDMACRDADWAVSHSRDLIIRARRKAIQAGMLVGGSLDACATITEADTAKLNALKNVVGGVVGAACGAGMTPGAIVGPLAVAAINAAFDKAWETRDFAKAAHQIRAHLEAGNLTAGDISSANGDSNAHATRYFAWINTAIHAVGRS